jgi:hypothetical protein
LITKLISAFSSEFSFNLLFLIDNHPFLVYHLSKAEIHSILAQSPFFGATKFQLLLSIRKLVIFGVPECFRGRYGEENFQLEDVRDFGSKWNSLALFLKLDF